MHLVLWRASLANCMISQRAEYAFEHGIPVEANVMRVFWRTFRFDPAHRQIELKGPVTMGVSEVVS